MVRTFFAAVLLSSCGLGVISSGDDRASVSTRLDTGEAAKPGACIYTGPAESRGRVDVTWFGAVGDATTDDTQAFQCAIAWLSPGGGGRSNGGGTVVVPGGHYNVSDTLDLPPGLQLVGSNCSAAGFCQLRLTQPGRPLLRLRNAVNFSSVVVRDLELRYLGPNNANWPINAALTAASGTTGILLTGALNDGWMQQLTFDNLTIAGFRDGIAVDSGLTDRAADPMVDGVRVSMVYLQANTVGLRARSWNLSNWNVENLNIYQLEGQTGVRVEGSGMSLFQLNCQSHRDRTGAPIAGACLELREFVTMRVRELHAEGTRYAIHVLPSVSPHQGQLVLQQSNPGEGLFVEGFVHLLSTGNTYAGTGFARVGPGEGKAEFVGAGAHSLVTSLGDQFVNPYTGQHGGRFLGLAVAPQVLDDEGLRARRVSVVGIHEQGAALLEAIAPTQPGQALLKLGQNDYHYTMRRSGSTGYLDLTGNQVADPNSTTWPTNQEWTGLSVNGALQLRRYTRAPNACSPAFDGALAMTSLYTTCVCRPDRGWVSTGDGTSACGWQ